MPVSNAGRLAEYRPAGRAMLIRHWNGVLVNSRPARGRLPPLSRVSALPGPRHSQRPRTLPFPLAARAKPRGRENLSARSGHPPYPRAVHTVTPVRDLGASPDAHAEQVEVG
jgi:hypothetical protein